MKSVIVFAEEPVVGIGLRAVLGDGSEFEPVAVCRSATELVHAASQFHPDLVLYVLTPETDLSLLQELRSAAPQCQIVLLAREITSSFASQAIELGARALLSTTSSPESLQQCLHLASTGQICVDKSLSEEMLQSRSIKLSPRQGELVGLLVRGLRNKEIAAAMGVTEGTIKAYLTTLFEKVGAKDRFELALFGLKNLNYVREDGDQRVRKHEPLHSLVRPRMERTRT